MLSFVPTAGAGGDRLKTLLAPLVRVLDGVYSRPVLLLPTFISHVAHLRLRRARALSMMNTYISMLNLHCFGRLKPSPLAIDENNVSSLF